MHVMLFFARGVTEQGTRLKTSVALELVQRYYYHVLFNPLGGPLLGRPFKKAPNVCLFFFFLS